MNLVDITSAVENINPAMFLTSPGAFVYETKFTVDETAALNQGVNEIVFEFFTSDPGRNAIPLKSNTFTFKISERTGESNAKKEVVYLRSPSVEKLSIASPIYAVSERQPPAQMTFKDSARNSEANAKKDPAQVLSSTRVLGTTPNKIINLGNNRNASTALIQNFDRVGAKSSEGQTSLAQKRKVAEIARKSDGQSPVISSFLSLPEIVAPNSLVRTLPVASVEVISKKTDITRQLIFEKTDLLGVNKLYMKVSANVKERTRATVQPTVYVISHISEVGDFLGNAEPPIIQISESTLGRVSFILRKSDPTLRKVAVIRIIKNPNYTKQLLEKIAILNFDDRDSIVFTNEVDNLQPNIVVYRFVTLNDDGSSGEFSSVIIPSYTKVIDQKKSMSTTTPISIRAINQQEGISLIVDTLNDQVFSLRLLRQDLGSIGSFSDTVVTVYGQDGSYSQIIDGKKTSIQFLDRDVVVGRHYRYFAAYRLGSTAEVSLYQETISDEDEVIIRLRPNTNLPFSANLTPAIVNQDSDNVITVNFEMQVKEVEEQFNVLFDALRKSGVSEQFIIDLQNDRQKTRDVAAFLVERVDRETGKRCTFGIYPPGKFEDSPTSRSEQNIPEPIAGRKYEYICKMCIRPPATFLLGATVGFVATSDASGDITNVIAAKFKNALIDRGIIPSERQLRDGVSIKENFLLGQTGVEISNEIQIPSFSPQIENVEVKKRKSYNLISWNVKGDVSNVSFFLVYCNYNGSDELIGTVSSVGSASSYQFKDTVFCDEVGQINYFVKIVTLDHDVSVPSPQVSTLTVSSFPLEGFSGQIIAPSNTEGGYFTLESIGGLNAFKPAPQKSAYLMRTETGEYVTVFPNDTKKKESQQVVGSLLQSSAAAIASAKQDLVEKLKKLALVSPDVKK